MSKHRGWFRANSELIAALFKFPPGIEVKNVRYDFERDEWLFAIEDATGQYLCETLPGNMYPEAIPQYAMVRGIAYDGRPCEFTFMDKLNGKKVSEPHEQTELFQCRICKAKIESNISAYCEECFERTARALYAQTQVQVDVASGVVRFPTADAQIKNRSFSYGGLEFEVEHASEMQNAADIKAGKLTVDELRARRGRPPLPDGAGHVKITTAVENQTAAIAFSCPRCGLDSKAANELCSTCFFADTMKPE